MSKQKKIIVAIVVSIIITMLLTGGILFACGVFTPDNETPPTINSISSSNFENRIYVKDGGLYGDEKATIINSEGNKEEVLLSADNFKYFNTSTIGKKLAQVTIQNKTAYYSYYVISSLQATTFNCILKVNNLFTNYYVNEMLNLDNVTFELCENVNGYIVKTNIPLTSAMISGFSNSTVGTRTMKISYMGYEYDVAYSVRAINSDKVTSASFNNAVYFPYKTVQESEHFTLNIAAGTYLANNCIELMEQTLLIQEEVSGLQFNSKITVEVNSTFHPSCGGTTIYTNSGDLFLNSSSAFAHELAHALDHSQVGGMEYNGTLTEGFAQYMEFLTVKQIKETDQEFYAITETLETVVNNIDALGDEMHFYDFEEKLLYLNRDELVGNSQYEVGARFFAYLNHRYSDFCGWMLNSEFRTENISDWKNLLKQYYNNQNLFSEFYAYEQQLADTRNILCGNTEVVKYDGYLNGISNNLAGVSKYNYYFKLANLKQYQGNLNLIYKDLYLNVESARDQLRKSNIAFSEITLKTDKQILLELYDANGQIVRTISNTTQTFTLAGVSFIKLVGNGVAKLEFGY